ncbi:GNAT family N-acetyltransferase [Pontibacter sp. H249]|uniref:GNAT family N-acetyltransferase n=1 Tax=Pontibacter sp. H249 TaxID=3133420 RepID=UPI0030BAE555
MALYLRAATVEDLKAVKAIDEALFGEDTYPLFALRQMLDITEGLFKVALLDDKVVGYAIGHYNSEAKQAWLLSLGVLLAYRGQGIGEKLTHTLLAEVEAKGANTSYLTVHPDNKQGINIYKKLGFVEHHSVSDYYGDGIPRLIMVKASGKV